MDILFPHDEYRKVQKGFVSQVYACLQNGTSMLVHAPTGIGKTASALASALTYALEKKKIVFFLTSRHTQHKIAIDTLNMIKEKHGKPFYVVDLIGKKWMCNQPSVGLLTSSEFSEFCKDLREKDQCPYYTKIKKGLKLSFKAQHTLNKMKKASPAHVKDMNEVCFKEGLCAFEMACIFAKKAHVVIADYNHLLQPSIRDTILKRMDKTMDDIIVICDEAHNVPQRARNILTRSMSTTVIDYAVKEMNKLKFGGQAEFAEDIKGIIMSLSKKMEFNDSEVLISKEDFSSKVGELGDYQDIAEEFFEVSREVLENKKKSFSGWLGEFMDQWQGPDEGFVRIVTKGFDGNGKPFVSLNYKCLDPSILMKDVVEKAHGFIAMSGTLTPLTMYRDLFGVDEGNSLLVDYQNPFPKENRLTMIIPEGTTKFTARGAVMSEFMARKINGVVNSVPGNSAVFFPSYQLQKEIGALLQKGCEKTIFYEEPGLTSEERADVLERFKKYKNVGAVLLGVSAGSFGEGIDLMGDYLKGVVVVGLPLSKPDLETKELIKYYDKKYGKGWNYGYIFPAIIKTLQNAGRCIRSETDKGVIAFLDERYVWKMYQDCFPTDWDVVVEKSPKDKIEKFFS